MLTHTHDVSQSVQAEVMQACAKAVRSLCHDTPCVASLLAVQHALQLICHNVSATLLSAVNLVQPRAVGLTVEYVLLQLSSLDLSDCLLTGSLPASWATFSEASTLS